MVDACHFGVFGLWWVWCCILRLLVFGGLLEVVCFVVVIVVCGWTV